MFCSEWFEWIYTDTYDVFYSLLYVEKQEETAEAIGNSSGKWIISLLGDIELIYVSLRLRVQNRRRKTKSAAQFQHVA